MRGLSFGFRAPGRVDERAEASVLVPWVDEVNARSIEVADVTSGQDCMTGSGDTGDLYIANLYRPTSSLSICCNSPRSERGGLVEHLNAAVEIFFEHLHKAPIKPAAAATALQKVYSCAYFEDGDRGGPDRLGWLIVEPAHYGRIGCVPHQRRKHVGIEQDHESNCAGRTG